MSSFSTLSVIARRLAFGLVCLALTACSGKPEQIIHTLTGATMGTTYSVKIVAASDLDTTAIARDIQAVLDRIESRMSTYRQDSELSLFNHSAPDRWFPISDETAAVVALGLDISEQTQGSFDMTVGPLVNLWGFGPDKHISKAPDEQQITDLMRRIGYQHISLRPSLRNEAVVDTGETRITAVKNETAETGTTVATDTTAVTVTTAALLKRTDSYLDLSAIAKGYAVDQVVAQLSSRFDAFLVEVGGELRARGEKPGNQQWRIAVESPQPGARVIQRIIHVKDTAIATSGDYRNYFEQDGVRYSHTIDPKTGRPITHRLASVTIIDPSCARADAMATAMMVLGDEAGYQLALAMDLAAFFIVKQEQGFIEKRTPAFEQYLVE